MGDCRLRIQISRELIIDTENSISNDNRNEWVTISKICSADTTIREVVEEITVDVSSSSPSFALLPLLQAHQVCLWDCTTHPPVDISDWPVSIYTEKGGPNSKTLFDARWYPSGSLQVVPAGQGPKTASAGHYDDSQYNLPSDSIQPSAQQQQARVQLLSSNSTPASAAAAATTTMLQGLPAPSQVLHAVTKRFADDGDDEAAAAQTAAAIRVRRQNQQMVAAKQTERFLKLEQRIRLLQEGASSGGKNKKVSDQVRNMLIKSRATGRSDLKMQDRVFLHGMIDQGETASHTMGEDYRYFSLQDTVGRVLSTFASTTETGKGAELLIRWSPKTTESSTNENETAPVYRRLPTLMRLYEAISHQYLADIDTVVIRVYNYVQEEATPSVIDSKEQEEEEEGMQPERMDTVQPDMMDTETSATTENDAAGEEKSPTNSTDDADEVTNCRLTDAIRAMDERKDPKKKKKSSTAATKVRQMQMKSKATGDAKQVKMEDRFFLELVTVTDDTTGDQCTATTAPVFVSLKNDFERLVRDNGKKAPMTCQSWPWEILVPLSDDAENSSYRRISDYQMSFHDAQQSKMVNPFDRLILRYFQQ
jgi:hypothetical protein